MATGVFNRIAAILVIFVVGLSACTKKRSASYGLDPKETLRITLMTEPPSLDWNKSSDVTSATIELNLMEGLVQYDLQSSELSLKPALATTWESKDNSKRWLFTLRDDVKWTDGVPFTGQQVIDGWERLLNPTTASLYAYFLYGVKNARKYNEGKLTDFSQVGIRLNDKGQLEIELEGPQSYFPYLLTHHSTYPIRKDVIKKFSDKWTDPENIQTLGPFKLKTWEHDKVVILERNENYFGEKAKVKYVLAYIVNEMSTALNLFNAKQIDVQASLPSTELGSLKKRKEYKEHGTLVTYYYGFNTRKPPFNNPDVRKAISFAIDRKQITNMLAGGQIPLTSWIPPGMFGYEPGRGISFDVAKAKSLLAKAGYADRSDFPKITIGFNTNEDHQRVAENIQAQLKNNLGIQVELKNEEWKVYLNTLKASPPNIFRLGWQADFPDPDNFMNLMTSYSENNHTLWGSKKFDQLVEAAATTTDKSKRKELYSEAQRILTEQEVPAVPIYAGVSHLLIADRVKGFPLTAMGVHQYKGVSLK